MGNETQAAVNDASIRGDMFGFFESSSSNVNDHSNGNNRDSTTGWGEGKPIVRALDKMVSAVGNLKRFEI